MMKFRLVGGTDVDPALADSAPPAGPAVSFTAPYSGLPMVPPRGDGDDMIYRDIERHRAAVDAYNQAVETHCAAEGKVSVREYEALQATSSAAFQDMMLFGRMLAITTAKTRRGLIHQVSYLALQFNDFNEECENGCHNMPEDINGRPWPEVFLKRLAKQLRRMGPELDPAKRRTRAKTEAVAQMGGDEWRKAVDLFISFEEKGMAPHAVKCLRALLTTQSGKAAVTVHRAARRAKGQPVASTGELRTKIDRLDEGDQRYMDGYIQGLIDGQSV